MQCIDNIKGVLFENVVFESFAVSGNVLKSHSHLCFALSGRSSRFSVQVASLPVTFAFALDWIDLKGVLQDVHGNHEATRDGDGTDGNTRKGSADDFAHFQCR